MAKSKKKMQAGKRMSAIGRMGGFASVAGLRVEP
jgi:hypothetical protein